ncbi:hypothetical protein ABZ464_25120 [Streptomyces sp. NPDC005820]|uniref:hypothetical protein n=1 Tax=Streptomyces sp. NPDC005820 TaxID=3157069 RepID=UPI0033E66655
MRSTKRASVYREDGELAEGTIVWQYGDFALRLAGVKPEVSVSSPTCSAGYT